MYIALGTPEMIRVTEFEELARVVDVDESVSTLLPELFLGLPGESKEEHAARLDAARDILTELRVESPELAEHAARLLAVTSLPRHGGSRRSMSRGAAA